MILCLEWRAYAYIGVFYKPIICQMVNSMGQSLLQTSVSEVLSLKQCTTAQDWNIGSHS